MVDTKQEYRGRGPNYGLNAYGLDLWLTRHERGNSLFGRPVHDPDALPRYIAKQDKKDAARKESRNFYFENTGNAIAWTAKNMYKATTGAIKGVWRGILEGVDKWNQYQDIKAKIEERKEANASSQRLYGLNEDQVQARYAGINDPALRTAMLQVLQQQHQNYLAYVASLPVATTAPAASTTPATPTASTAPTPATPAGSTRPTNSLTSRLKRTAGNAHRAMRKSAKSIYDEIYSGVSRNRRATRTPATRTAQIPFVGDLETRTDEDEITPTEDHNAHVREYEEVERNRSLLLMSKGLQGIINRGYANGEDGKSTVQDSSDLLRMLDDDETEFVAIPEIGDTEGIAED